jgi:hypothetical protein
MVSSTDMNNAARVVSIKALDYELVPNNTFHPSLYPAACSRITEQFANQYASHPRVKKLTKILTHVLAHPACPKVWAIVLEEDGNPLYVIRNLKFTGTALAFRRVFRVKLDALLAPPARTQQPSVIQPIILYKPEPLSGMSYACAVSAVGFQFFLMLYTMYMLVRHR